MSREKAWDWEAWLASWKKAATGVRGNRLGAKGEQVWVLKVEVSGPMGTRGSRVSCAPLKPEGD